MYPNAIKKFKYLRWFMNILAVLPLKRNTWFIKLYSIFILILAIWTFHFEISGRIEVGFKNTMQVTPAGIVVGTINTTVELLYNILITLTAVVFSNNSKEELLKEIDELDGIIRKHSQNLERKQKFMYKDIILLHIFDTALFINDILLFLPTKDKEFLAYYYIDQFYRYRISLLVLYIYCFIKELLGKLLAINEHLRETFNNLNSESMLQESSEVLQRMDTVVQDVSVCYLKFGQIVGHFNNIFGWLLLALFINYLCLFMVAFDMGLRIKTNSAEAELPLYIWVGCLMIYALVGTLRYIFM